VPCTTATSELGDDHPHYSLCPASARDPLPTRLRRLWVVTANKKPQVMRLQVGHGTVTIFDSLWFDNDDLLKGDHGALFVAATQLHRGMRIDFATRPEHSSLISLMWQHAAAVMLLVLLFAALLTWRAAARFGPLLPETVPVRRSLAEQIRGLGRFLAAGNGAAALQSASLRALQETARVRISGWGAVPEAEQPALLARLSGVTASRLQSALHSAKAGDSTELFNTVATLETTRRRLLSPKR